MSAADMIFATCLFILLFCLFSYGHFRYSLIKTIDSNGCAPPKSLPSLDPFFGLDTVFHTFRTMKNHCRMRTINSQINKYGHTFQSFPFRRRIITTTSARNIQHILSLEHKKFGVRPARQAAEAMLGRGMITDDGPVWQHARAMIRPAFTKSQITDEQMFDTHFERFLSLLPQDGSAVDLQPLFDRLVESTAINSEGRYTDRGQILDASSEFIFGQSFESLLPTCSNDSRNFLESFNEAQKGVGLRVFIGKMKFLLISDLKFRKACKFIQEFTEKHVDDAFESLSSTSEKGENKGKRRHILLYELAQETSDRPLLCSQLLNVFFAGRDTPAAALTNIFFLLARHPETWRKCRKEVRGLKPQDLTFGRLKSVKYVQYVVKECLRLLPPVASISRGCLAPSILPNGGGGDCSKPVRVMPGDTLTINIFSLNRNPGEYGPDPDTFRPERWVDARPMWEYLPFGGGARHCPAQQLGLFWVTYTLVRLLQKYKEIRNEDPVHEFVENLKLNMESHNGAKVSFISA